MAKIRKCVWMQRLLVLLVVLSVSFCGFSITSRAAFTEFNSGYSRPSVSDFSGYIEINAISATKPNYPMCFIFTWNLQGSVSSTETAYVDITLNEYTVNFKGSGTDWMVMLYWTCDGSSRPDVIYDGNTSVNGYTNDLYSDYKIVAYHVYGNYGSITDKSGSSYFGNSFAVQYGSDYSVNKRLDEISDLLEDLNNGNLTTDEYLQESNRLQEEMNGLQEEENELQKEANETNKGILSSISDFFGGFFDNLIDSILGVFIPDSDFFQNYFDDLYSFFTDKLGILVYPFKLMADFIGAFLNVGEGSGEIVIPDVVMFDTVIIQATRFNLKDAMSQALDTYYDVYYAFVDCLILFGFVTYAKKKFDSVVGGTGE